MNHHWAPPELRKVSHGERGWDFGNWFKPTLHARVCALNVNKCTSEQCVCVGGGLGRRQSWGWAGHPKAASDILETAKQKVHRPLRINPTVSKTVLFSWWLHRTQTSLLRKTLRSGWCYSREVAYRLTRVCLGSIPRTPSLREKGKKGKTTETQRLAWLIRMLRESTPLMGMTPQPLREM